MEIVVNDTNIFIDLCCVDLLEEFFMLPYEVHTLDMVLAELTHKEQRRSVETFVERGKLYVHKMSGEEIKNVSSFMEGVSNQLSFTDCAACCYAKENGYTLLAADGNLRKAAMRIDVKVCGSIFLFDEMVKNNVITTVEAAIKLEKLRNINQRLPQKDIDDRIQKWKK